MEIAQRFNLRKLLHFALPTVVMMLFSAIYTIVDGIFVSRCVNSDALSAINIVYPVIFIIMGIAIMLGTGGNAVVGRNFGEGRPQEARQNFTLLCLITAAIGLLFAIIMLLFLEPLINMLGASPRLYPYCRDYALIMFAAAPAVMLQLSFQLFFVAAGKPKTGMYLTVICGVANILLDYLFIVPLGMEISGAAWGTALSCLIGALYPLFYFRRRQTPLYFVRPVWRGRMILRSMANGASEMVSNIAAGITTLLFNLAMMEMLGEDGVAAITMVLYTQYLFTAVFIGFSNGVAPVISYNYGNNNIPQLQRLFKISFCVIVLLSLIMVLLAQAAAETVIGVFTARNTEIFALALHGFHIFAWNFLMAGLNIFSSAFFTALSDGLDSALISFLRTFAFQVLAILYLPRLLQVDGIWLAIPLAELLTLLIAAALLLKRRGRYQYF